MKSFLFKNSKFIIRKKSIVFNHLGKVSSFHYLFVPESNKLFCLLNINSSIFLSRITSIEFSKYVKIITEVNITSFFDFSYDELKSFSKYQIKMINQISLNRRNNNFIQEIDDSYFVINKKQIESNIIFRTSSNILELLKVYEDYACML